MVPINGWVMRVFYRDPPPRCDVGRGRKSTTEGTKKTEATNHRGTEAQRKAQSKTEGRSKTGISSLFFFLLYLPSFVLLCGLLCVSVPLWLVFCLLCPLWFGSPPSL